MQLPVNTVVMEEGVPVQEGSFPVIPNSLIREKAAYEAAGIDPAVTILLPFAANVSALFNISGLADIGVDPLGLARQCDQLLKENIGNNWKAKRKAGVESDPPVYLGQEQFDKIYANYDFSGARAAVSSEDDFSDEEIELRRVLRDQLKSYLRDGNILAGAPKLTVQKAKDAKENKLPAGTFPLDEFDALVEAAASKSKWTFDWSPFNVMVQTADGPVQLMEHTIDFGAKAKFNDAGQILNHAAIVAVAEVNAQEVLKTKRENAARLKPAAIAA